MRFQPKTKPSQKEKEGNSKTLIQYPI
uniref:Uncharacterized protein n=1 Tax=Tetranychus urticae TaxID=32264 RepID=T1KIG7_TETUR